MPRNVAGAYSLPAGSTVTDAVDDILASQHNTPLQDIAADLNIARPVVAGGTGATTALGARSALGIGKSFDDVAAILADTALTYTAGQPGTVIAGDIVQSRKEGFSYRVAASGASDQNVTTSGGVKLYVLPTDIGEYNVLAFGAVCGGAAGPDNAVPLNAAAAALGAFVQNGVDSTLANFRPRLIFPPGLGYRSSVEFVIDGGVDVIMHSPIIRTGVTAGSSGNAIRILDNRNIDYQAQRLGEYVLMAERGVQSNWTQALGTDTGIYIEATYVARIYIKRSHGFRVAFDISAGYGDVQIGSIRDAQRSIFATRTSPENFTNQIKVNGGTFSCDGGVNVGLPRWGIEIIGAATLGGNTFVFDGQSFELANSAGVAIPYLINGTAGNVSFVTGVNQRSEGNSRTFVQVIGEARGVQMGIREAQLEFISPTQLLVDNQSTNAASVYCYRDDGANAPNVRPIYNSGALAENVIQITGALFAIRGMEFVDTLGARSAIGIGLSVDTDQYLSAVNNLYGVRVALNGENCLMVSGAKKLAQQTNMRVLCYNAAGVQINAPNKVFTEQSAFIHTSGLYGGLYTAGLYEPGPSQDLTSQFDTVIRFTPDVATAFISTESPIRNFSIGSYAGKATVSSLTMARQDQLVASAIPIAMTNVTYPVGMFAGRATPASGQPRGWMHTGGGTWVAAANL